jgi:hypothetical protein
VSEFSVLRAVRVPPGRFATQFMRDLHYADELSQIRWIFDGAKNPPNFRANMMRAIDNLPLTDDMAIKFLNRQDATIYELRNLLRSNFDNIFQLR